MTTIDIPDYITKPKSLADLTHAAGDLLRRAAESDLPVPGNVTLYQGCQEVRFGFRGEPDSFHTFADWAALFGGTVTGEPYTHDDGRESVYCQVKFPYQGVTVEAYAFIPADQLSIT
jgi:hypothetical protein